MLARASTRSMPMWVIQVKDVLEMTGTMQPHQVLKAQGLLEIWRVTMFTLFVSHQWLSFHHPDPNGEQLKVLQLVLRKLIAKQLTIQGNVWSEYSASKARTKDLDGVGKWYMWLDYFCVPQLVGHSVLGVGEQHSYIESIPSYVDPCSAFVELVPQAVHQDLRVPCLVPDRMVVLSSLSSFYPSKNSNHRGQER